MGTKIPRMLLGYKVKISPFLGSGPVEPVYSGAVWRRAHVIFGRPINTSIGAEETTGDVQVYIDPDIDVPERSKVEINGSIYTVIRSDKHVAPSLPTPDHIKLILVPYAED